MTRDVGRIQLHKDVPGCLFLCDNKFPLSFDVLLSRCYIRVLKSWVLQHMAKCTGMALHSASVA